MTIIQPLATFATIMSLAVAASAQPYEIPWYTIDGGGGTSAGGTFQLAGTIGQPDAGPTMTGGGFSLTGGFWAGVGPAGCNQADLAAPYGLLDLTDITTFVVAFTGQDPLADLNNDGLFALDDITTFVTAFLAGCP
ncbi:MAG: hypothetical protein H6810_11130 [Phycisphaeraceae bacterium]|nr:MAG: hypothetical protein H6810_11130 [Phycisphaeraceae bacterium]